MTNSKYFLELTIKLIIFIFFGVSCVNFSFSQNASDFICPTNVPYIQEKTERRFVVNPVDVEFLLRKDSTFNEVGLARQIFIQTIIEATDRWNHIGSGTFVYAGETTQTEVPLNYDNVICPDPNRRNLIMIRTLSSENPDSFAARVHARCWQNGIPHGFRIDFYLKLANGQSVAPTYFSSNAPGFDLASLALHEFGHVYRIEHADNITPNNLVVMNATVFSRIPKEWDIKCIIYRAGIRSYSLLFREVTSSGIGSEQVYINASASPNSGVADFAPGKFNFLWSSIDSLIYELPTVTRWHQNVSIGTLTDVTPPLPTSAINTGFQVWQEEPGRVPKYIWAQVDNTSNWDDFWRLRVRSFDFSLNSWQPNNNSNYLSRVTPSEFIAAQFVPSIAHLNSATFGQRTISVWSESDASDNQTTRISSGTIGSTNISNTKNLTYTLPNGTQGMLNPYIPMSIACRGTDDLCLVAFIANDFYDSNINDPQGWRNKNAVMIGQVNLQNLINGTGTSNNLTNVQGLPNLVVNSTMPSVRMRSASKPLILFDGTNFRVIFRGSYMAGQKLTAFRSTNGVNWIHDTVFSNMMSIPFNPFNNHTSYSSVAPTAAAYMNGATRIYYSRPLTTSY